MKKKSLLLTAKATIEGQLIVQVAAAVAAVVVFSQVFSAISALLFNFRFWAIVF